MKDNIVVSNLQIYILKENKNFSTRGRHEIKATILVVKVTVRITFSGDVLFGLIRSQ